MLQIENIYLSMDSRKEVFMEEPEGITDVVVELRSGERFLASFFSYEKVGEMIKEFKNTGKYLGGSFFWVKNMILIDKCEKETITQVVEHLIEEGDFLDAFSRISAKS